MGKSKGGMKEGLSPAFTCQGNSVGQGGICQCHGGGEGYGAGDIGNGVVDVYKRQAQEARMRIIFPTLPT